MVAAMSLREPHLLISPYRSIGRSKEPIHRVIRSSLHARSYHPGASPPVVGEPPTGGLFSWLVLKHSKKIAKKPIVVLASVTSVVSGASREFRDIQDVSKTAPSKARVPHCKQASYDNSFRVYKTIVIDDNVHMRVGVYARVSTAD